MSGRVLPAEEIAGLAALETTPGPWALHQCPDHGCDSSGNAPGCRMVVLASGCEIASDLLASEEDLTMFAAAPDLLATSLDLLQRQGETPRHLRVALANAARAFQRDDLAALGTVHEALQPLVDAAAARILDARAEVARLQAELAKPVAGVWREDVADRWLRAGAVRPRDRRGRPPPRRRCGRRCGLEAPVSDCKHPTPRPKPVPSGGLFWWCEACGAFTGDGELLVSGPAIWRRDGWHGTDRVPVVLLRALPGGAALVAAVRIRGAVRERRSVRVDLASLRPIRPGERLPPELEREVPC